MDTIRAWLNRLPRTYVRKVHGSGYSAGWADLLGSHHGRTLYLEVKRPGEDETTLQAAERAKWAATGALTGVVRSVQDVAALLSALTTD